MITDDGMHDLFSQALPGDEPDLRDFRPAARADGARLRRRRRIRVGAAALAFSAVLAGTVAATTWPEHTATGPTATGPAASQAATTPRQQLLDALTADPVLRGATVTDGPRSDAVYFEVAQADGAKWELQVVPDPYLSGGVPGRSCGVPSTNECSWVPLPDGSRAATGALSMGGVPNPEGLRHTWLTLETPDGRVVHVISTKLALPNGGYATGTPLPEDQLLALAKNARVLAAIRALPSKSASEEPPPGTPVACKTATRTAPIDPNSGLVSCDFPAK
ncbi:hypothetical protein [Yinghuangia seranimata]|uniref:hypothetical protein n=1 Tax=Yinghuangia seranimata TaxID=408067 RepID=UPI00248C20A3|nr:hypothetical protein [Yinghuangia seranimata]MDI2130302.1 hypothetical protein [Yinghuangia seranimata]